MCSAAAAGSASSSRAPELQTSQLTRAGVTSVIGMLGFDATSKDMRALIAKTKAFREDGVSAWALTGATLSVRLNEIRPEIPSPRGSAERGAWQGRSRRVRALCPFKIVGARRAPGLRPIDEFRDQLDRKLSPAIRRRLQREFARVFARPSAPETQDSALGLQAAAPSPWNAPTRSSRSSGTGSPGDVR